MPLNLDLATLYIIDAFRANFILLAELFRAIAINSTIADYVTQDIYYIFGSVYWLSYALSDMAEVVNSELAAGNATWINWVVGYWQKTAINSKWVFGDWEGNWGIAYVWKRGWECIQPGQYCFNVGYGNETVRDALEMIKWLFNATSQIGGRMPNVYS